ncbi:MAG: ferritin [Puniceicoccales bacterium]|jgi:ferritin|nr:ferritin [Puniceicoccales bacterium]
MKLSQKIEEGLNLQMHHEFDAAYIYLGLAAALDATVFTGFGHWMRKQYEEELAHAMKFYRFINERHGKVRLRDLIKPDFTITTPLQAFEKAYQIELDNTQNIHRLYALSVEEKDYATQEFLHYFIKEQVEEESSVQTIIDQLKFVGDRPAALFSLDQRAGQR